MRKKSLNYAQEKLKPWGREIWFAWTSRYAGKILEIKKGHRYSLQYHEKKIETQFVMKGKVKYEFSKPGMAKKLLKNWKGGQKNLFLRKKVFLPGDKIDFPPYTIHRATALTDCLIFEVSSPELTDVVKLSDDYGRTGKGNNEKLDARLARKRKK